MKLKLIIFIVLTAIFHSCDDVFADDISNESVNILAPLDGSTVSTNPIAFDWENLKGAENYELQIATPTFDAATQIVLDTVLTNNTFSYSTPPDDYEWRIRALNVEYQTEYSQARFTATEDISFVENEIILLNPRNNLSTNNPNQTLEWQNLEEAIEYRVQYELDNMLIYDQNLGNNFLQQSFSEGQITWRVRATNGSENTDYFERSFTVDLTAPSQPQLENPTDGELINSLNVNFSWDRLPDTGSVEVDSVFIYDDISQTQLYNKGRGINSEYTESFIQGETYYWNVQSFDEAGNASSVSQTFSFTIN